MRMHVLQHVPFEGPGAILDWAEAKGAAVGVTRFWEAGWTLPSLQDIDLLVVMGGPMGVHDEAKHPWLAQEKNFIAECIGAGRKLLGICLGAQLAALALGARVYPNREKEIGWFPVYKTSLPHPVFHHMPEEHRVFHWHGDTFDLPDGALHLAYSDACAHQSFIWNDQVLALQYHIEVSGAHITALLEHGEEDLKSPGRYVQTDTLIRQRLQHSEAFTPLLSAMLDSFAAA